MTEAKQEREGPGGLADASDVLAQLAAAGIAAQIAIETQGFDFPDFASAWDTLAVVTTAQLPPECQQEANTAVLTALYPQGDGPRHNTTQFIVGRAGGKA
jgi:hypothetical protein